MCSSDVLGIPTQSHWVESTGEPTRLRALCELIAQLSTFNSRQRYFIPT